MTKHTPGPWCWVGRAGGWDGVDAATGEQICRLEFNNPENARLISAAPDMLTALQGIAQTLKAQIAAGIRWDPREVDAVFAAIGKATDTAPLPQGSHADLPENG